MLKIKGKEKRLRLEARKYLYVCVVCVCSSRIPFSLGQSQRDRLSNVTVKGSVNVAEVDVSAITKELRPVKMLGSC